MQCLGYLARRRGPAALLLLGSFRPAELIAQQHALAGLRQELRLHRLCEEIDLDPFSEAELGTLVAARLQAAAVPEAFVQALHQHTGGLPLFVVNLLDELLAEAQLRPSGQGWHYPDAAALTVPAHIADVLDMQIARLPEPVQQALGAASVAGAEFLHLALALALQQAPDTLQRLLDGVVAQRHWLRSAGVQHLPGGQVAGRYAFRHALYRHVFYQRLSAGQRAAAHLALAQALQALHGDAAFEVAAELALHFERGGQPQAAAQQCLLVARRALARSAAREALQATAQGLALLAAAASPLPALELELRLLEAVALTRRHVVVDAEVQAAFARACALCERAPASPARARALHGLWWVHFARGELQRAGQLAQQMLDLAGDAPDPDMRLAGCTCMGLTLAMAGQLPAARAQLLQALQVFEGLRATLPPGLPVQDPGVEINGYLAVVRWWMGEPAAARAHMAAALARAAEVGNPLSQLIALHLQAGLHFFAGEVQRALDSTERLYAVIRDHDLPTRPGSFAWLHGHAVAALGDLQAGLAEMHEAERSCLAMGLRVGLSGYHLHHAQALQEAGQHAAALQALQPGLQMAQQGPEQYLLSPLLRVQAELQQALGQASAATDSLQQALQAATQQGADFHALAALVAAGRHALLPAAALQPRLQALLAAYAGESISVAEQARALLAG